MKAGWLYGGMRGTYDRQREEEKNFFICGYFVSGICGSGGSVSALAAAENKRY